MRKADLRKRIDAITARPCPPPGCVEKARALMLLLQIQPDAPIGPWLTDRPVRNPLLAIAWWIAESNHGVDLPMSELSQKLARRLIDLTEAANDLHS